MKACSKCHIEKDESEFGKDKKKKDGLFGSCKMCENTRRRKWDDQNQSRASEHQRSYRKKYDSRIREYVRRWCKENKHKKQEWRKKISSKLSDGYIKRVLRNRGFTTEEINELPILIDKKRLDILIYRSHKLKKQKS